MCHEFIKTAVFLNTSVFQNNDSIVPAKQGFLQSMRHHNARDTVQVKDVTCDLIRCLYIQSCRCFISQQHGGFFQQTPGNGNSLFFTPGQSPAVFTTEIVLPRSDSNPLRRACPMASSISCCGKLRNMVTLSRIDALKTNTFCWITDISSYSDSAVILRSSVPSNMIYIKTCIIRVIENCGEKTHDRTHQTDSCTYNSTFKNHGMIFSGVKHTACQPE